MPNEGRVINAFRTGSGDPMRRWAVTVGAAAVSLLVLMVGCQSYVTIDAGHRGVVTRWGQVQDRILPEGIAWRVPMMERVVEVSVRTMKYDAMAVAASKDLQDTKTKVAVNYHLDVLQVNKIYQQLGLGFEDTIIQPAVQEVVKAVTARFVAEELITKRVEVRTMIEDQLKNKVASYGILIVGLAITEFRFSEEFEKAVEQKVTAEQMALKATNDLRRIKVEAEQVVAKARGEAEGIAMVQRQLSASPQYVKYLAVQKWDGKMPQFVGGNGPMPMIEIPR